MLDFHPTDEDLSVGTPELGRPSLVQLQAARDLERFQGSCKLRITHPCGVLVFAARVGSHDAHITATVKML